MIGTEFKSEKKIYYFSKYISSVKNLNETFKECRMIFKIKQLAIFF